MKEIEQTLSSVEVAEMVEKEHKQILKDIRRYIAQFNEGKISPVDFFNESTYNDSKGESRPCYRVTKKGCEFIAHKLTGIKGTKFTATYINRFHEMENALQTQTAPIAIQQFMERQQNLMEELVKMNQSMSERIAVLESKNKEPVGLIVGPGAKHYTVAEDENTSRKKKLNMLVTKMAKACGWTRSFALHRLYKTIEEVLDVSIDDYVDFYKEEVQGDACAIDAIAAYNHLYATAIRLCNNTLTQMSVEV